MAAVIATQRGYYAGRVIEAGEPVPLAEGEALGSWMRRVGAEAGEAEAGPVSDWAALTIPELREIVPDAPARATKAELIALIEAKAEQPAAPSPAVVDPITGEI